MASDTRRFIVYETASPKRRSWMLLEDDGSEDGRMIAGDITAEDADFLAQTLELAGHQVSRES